MRQLTMLRFHGSSFRVSDKINLMLSNNHGVPCSSRSKMSMSLVSSPVASMLSFSRTCGSGEKGASPSERHSKINRGKDILSKMLCIGPRMMRKVASIRSFERSAAELASMTPQLSLVNQGGNA